GPAADGAGGRRARRPHRGGAARPHLRRPRRRRAGGRGPGGADPARRPHRPDAHRWPPRAVRPPGPRLAGRAPPRRALSPRASLCNVFYFGTGGPYGQGGRTAVRMTARTQAGPRRIARRARWVAAVAVAVTTLAACGSQLAPEDVLGRSGTIARGGTLTEAGAPGVAAPDAGPVPDGAAPAADPGAAPGAVPGPDAAGEPGAGPGAGDAPAQPGGP